MTLRNTTPIAWRPLGITDAQSADQARKGSMQVLANLIPDPSTLAQFVCRPASSLIIDFNNVGPPFSSGFSAGFAHTSTFFGALGSATDITCFRIFGNRGFGMISGPAGFDYPFCYDLITNTIVPLTNGKNQALMPFTVPSIGDWTPFPPAMALVGTLVLVCHPGFTGGGPTNLFFGWFDVSNPNAVTWNAGNLQGGSAITFSAPPWTVENFNGRAYWAVNPPTGNPALIFSDVLAPLNCTSGTQIITFDDQQHLTALSPLPLNNQLGGIIQALMVFKGSAQVYQVTGDAASTTSVLAKNALNVATGTNSPLAIAVTSKGIAFVSPDGLRIIDFNAQVSDPIGWDGQGKTTAFIFQQFPSRAVAASTGTVFRVVLNDATLPNTPRVEYWLDVVRGLWTGPHQFANNSAPNAMDSFNNSFFTAIKGVPNKLWRSEVFQSSTSTFVENGTQLTWNYLTTPFPDTDKMSENNILEATITMAMDQNTVYPVVALDPSGRLLGSSAVFLPAASLGPIWGTATWGAFTWQAPVTAALFPRPINFNRPVVFRRIQFGISGASSINVKMSTLHCRYEELGYLQQSAVA